MFSPKRSQLPISILLLVILLITIGLSFFLEKEAGATDSQSTAATIHVDTTDVADYTDIWLGRGATFIAGTADVVKASSLGSTTVVYNDKSNPASDLSDAPPAPIKNVINPSNYSFAPYSVTLLTFSLLFDATNFSHLTAILR